MTTATADDPTETCVTCSNSGVSGTGWHNEFRHPLKRRHGDAVPNVFAPKILGKPSHQPQMEAPPSMPGVTPMAFPFDPVLRQALIDKGVLTPEDLTQAELKIRAVSGMVNSQLT